MCQRNQSQLGPARKRKREDKRGVGEKRRKEEEEIERECDLATLTPTSSLVQLKITTSGS